MQRLSALNFTVLIGDMIVQVESMTASIDDQTKAVKTNGIPNGYVSGEMSCSGEIEVDSQNFKLITDVARTAGSFEQLPPFDVLAIGKTLSQQQKIELFGCKFMISDLFAKDNKGGEKTKHKLKFEVTSPDFVRIDGVPVLSPVTTANL